MSLEKINQYIQEELKKREVTQEMRSLQEQVYEEIVLIKSKINSLSLALQAAKFAELDTTYIKDGLDQLERKLSLNKENLRTKLEPMIIESYKEDFIKVVKKTKFLQGMPITFEVFNNVNQRTLYLLEVDTNEELVKLLPYKIAELIKDERCKYTQIQKFVDLYSTQKEDEEITKWIDKYAKSTEDTQQVISHYYEILEMLQETIFTSEMVENLVEQWCLRIGLPAYSDDTSVTKEAIKEMSEVISNKGIVVG